MNSTRPEAASAELMHHRASVPAPPTDLPQGAAQLLATALNALLADVFALYLKTKSFQWQLSGANFPELHLLLDVQGEELFCITDPIAERCRVLGALTLHSVGQVSRLQRVLDTGAECLPPLAMLAELRDDNRQLAEHLRSAQELCNEYRDVASASALGRWLDETERRVGLLSEPRSGC